MHGERKRPVTGTRPDSRDKWDVGGAVGVVGSRTQQPSDVHVAGEWSRSGAPFINPASVLQMSFTWT